MSQPILLTIESACDAIASAIDVSDYEGLFSKVNFYTGIDNEDKVGPCVICSATEATELAPDLGVYEVKTAIIVKERAAKANRETTTLADTIFGGFLTGSIESELSSSGDNLTVYKAWVENQQSGIEGKFWVEVLNLNVVCAKT